MTTPEDRQKALDDLTLVEQLIEGKNEYTTAEMLVALHGPTFRACLSEPAQVKPDAMREALELAAKTFRWYEELHRAKPDHEKADRNRDLAIQMEKALASSPQVSAQTMGQVLIDGGLPKVRLYVECMLQAANKAQEVQAEPINGRWYIRDTHLENLHSSVRFAANEALRELDLIAAAPECEAK